MNFGRLSKATLIQLLGTSENYSYYNHVCDESIVQVLSDTCSSCPYFAQSNFHGDCSAYTEKCSSCPCYQTEKIYTSRNEKIYINEKNKYGHKSPVCKSAIKVWIALPFLSPDSIGLVKTTVYDIANISNLNVREVYYALDQLEQNKYIAHTADTSNCHNVCNIMITDYNKMHLSAKEGGKGYITLSRENLREIVSLKHINDIRAYLRIYLTCDDAAVKRQNYDYSTTIKRDVLKTWLPNYFTVGQIENVMKKMKSFFSLSLATVNNYFSSIKVEIKRENNGRINYLNQAQDYAYELTDYIEEVNHLVSYESDEPTRSKDIIRMAELNILAGPKKNWINKTVPITENSQELTDLAKLAIQFGITRVKTALSEVIRTYHFKDILIKSWGALTRTMIQLNFKFD